MQSDRLCSLVGSGRCLVGSGRCLVGSGRLLVGTGGRARGSGRSPVGSQRLLVGSGRFLVDSARYCRQSLGSGRRSVLPQCFLAGCNANTIPQPIRLKQLSVVRAAAGGHQREGQHLGGLSCTWVAKHLVISVATTSRRPEFY